MTVAQDTVIEAEIAVPFLRSVVYKWLSKAFSYPNLKEGFISSMLDGGFIGELREVVSSLHQLNFDDGGSLNKPLEALARTVEQMQPVSLENFQSEFTSVFGYTISKEYPPYETQYDSAHIFEQSQELADIAGFYKAFGLEIDENAQERLDHISIELEYMYFLAYKEAYARGNHGAEKVDICVDAQKKFLEEHLGKWAFHFAKLFRKKIKKGFYTELTNLMGAFLSSDMDWFGLEAPKVRRIKLTPFPSSADEEACTSCPEDGDGPATS